MNKYRVLLDIMKDKILFISDRYNYNDNKISIAEDLAILSNPKPKPLTSQAILKKKPSPQPTYNDDSNSTIDSNISSESTNKKRLTSTPRDIR